MRLPVILVQHHPASGAALADALVGNLIGRAGLDLTLVDRLESIADDSTDRMTLDGITVPSAVLDWQSPEVMLESLSAIEFVGVRCPHRLDPDATQNQQGRRLFLFDLRQFEKADAIVAELDRLKNSLAVRTFSLDPIGRNGSTSSKASNQPVANNAKVPVQRSAETPAVEGSIHLSSEPGSDDHLDRLIDQLDDLDV